jgi:2-iminobutanoate/2-iminopropanoate deaminase
MSKLKTIQTEKVPAVGPYSQAVIADNLIFCSGQIGLNGKTGLIVEGIEKQTHQVLNNLTDVLASAGSDVNHVVKTTIFLKNITDFAKVNEIYGSYFSSHKPARATVEVSHLPKDVLIEIDAIAIKTE